MLDHVTIRIADLAAATRAFSAVLDQLGIEQTLSTPEFSMWGNFAVTQTESEHPIAHRVDIAFIAQTPAQVDLFAQAGIHAGFTEASPAGPLPEHGEDYYAGSLKDAAGNSFAAVHHDGERPRGSIDHLAIYVRDVQASTAFYSTIGGAAGLAIGPTAPDRTTFAVGGSDGYLLVIAGEPTKHVHVAFSGSNDDVRRFHADAIAAGYRSNGEPGERARYHDGYYAAFVLDPDGNNIEVVDHNRPGV
jgi:catechol 2,3-dioxygenase-like lactoylglutathione lyase family enzyme